MGIQNFMTHPLDSLYSGAQSAVGDVLENLRQWKNDPAAAEAKKEKARQDSMNLMANAYPYAGDKTVLNTPEQIAAFRKEATPQLTDMAMGGSLLVANPAKLYDKLLAASVKSRVALAEQQLVKGAKDADLWADPKIKLSLTPGLVKPTLQNKFLMELPHPVDDLSQVLRRGNEYSVGDIYDNSPILKAIPGLQYHSAITGGHAPVSPKTTSGAFYPGKLLSEIYEPGLVSAEKSATTGAHEMLGHGVVEEMGGLQDLAGYRGATMTPAQRQQVSTLARTLRQIDPQGAQYGNLAGHLEATSKLGANDWLRYSADAGENLAEIGALRGLPKELPPTAWQADHKLWKTTPGRGGLDISPAQDIINAAPNGFPISSAVSSALRDAFSSNVKGDLGMFLVNRLLNMGSLP